MVWFSAMLCVVRFSDKLSVLTNPLISKGSEVNLQLTCIIMSTFGVLTTMWYASAYELKSKMDIHHTLFYLLLIHSVVSEGDFSKRMWIICN